MMTSEENNARTVNVLFPAFLAAGMHGTDNIDNEGTLKDNSVVDKATYSDAEGTDNVLNWCSVTTSHSRNLVMMVLPLTWRKVTKTSSKNVGGLTVGNAVPVAFNHLTGNFTEALVSTDAGGADQTASWGGTPVIRPGVLNNNNDDGMVPPTPTSPPTTWSITSPLPVWIPRRTRCQESVGGGRLAEKDAGGNEAILIDIRSPAIPTEGGNVGSDEINDGMAFNRGLTGGALVLPALYGGGDETQQIMLLLSAADAIWWIWWRLQVDSAMTKYNITLDGQHGDALPDPADDRVFGGATGPDLPTLGIIVNGIMRHGQMRATVVETHDQWRRVGVWPT